MKYLMAANSSSDAVKQLQEQTQRLSALEEMVSSLTEQKLAAVTQTDAVERRLKEAESRSEHAHKSRDEVENQKEALQR